MGRAARSTVSLKRAGHIGPLAAPVPLSAGAMTDVNDVVRPIPLSAGNPCNCLPCDQEHSGGKWISSYDAMPWDVSLTVVVGVLHQLFKRNQDRKETGNATCCV
jgi:hypothetical protein